uniref:Kinesin motor domain-containing protein n=1 Tax=viral metagenome TaxID=1070528 RepID=A0A6C0DBK2_9ZZZZ
MEYINLQTFKNFENFVKSNKENFQYDQRVTVNNLIENLNTDIPDKMFPKLFGYKVFVLLDIFEQKKDWVCETFLENIFINIEKFKKSIKTEDNDKIIPELTTTPQYEETKINKDTTPETHREPITTKMVTNDESRYKSTSSNDSLEPSVSKSILRSLNNSKFKSSLSQFDSSERKNRLDRQIIDLLKSNKTIEELDEYYEIQIKNSEIYDDDTKCAIKNEINKKKNKSSINTTSNTEFEELFKDEFNYNSDFQPSSVKDIYTKYNEYKDKKIDIEFKRDIFETFSQLNTGIYPKLISIMLNPEIFCKMFYDFNEINIPINNPFRIINFLLNIFFIKCYKIQSGNLETSFGESYKSEINRDTKIFKSLYIQNLISLRDIKIIEIQKNNNENVTEKVSDNGCTIERPDNVDYKIKLIYDFIEEKCMKIKDTNNDDKYIFNYKLLNLLPDYYNQIGKEKTIIAWQKLTYSNSYGNNVFESLLDYYYYVDQLKNSHSRLTKLITSITSGQSFIDNENTESSVSLESTPEKEKRHPVIASQSNSKTKKINYEYLITENYTNLIKSFAQVLTFVKERNDGHIYNYEPTANNPRYEIILTQEGIRQSENSIDIILNPISKDRQVSNKLIPDLNFYDLKIKYFNYPNRIGFKNDTDIYYDQGTWDKDKNGFYPSDHAGLNFDLGKATNFVKDNKQYIETYNMGKINRYYGSQIKSEQIANDPECGLILLNKLRNFENIIIIGNGQSGSGKTAALISLTLTKLKPETKELETETYPGLLPSIANKLIKNDSKPSKEQYFTHATVKLINLYVKLADNLNDLPKMKSKYYLPYNINLLDNSGNPIEGVKEYIFEPGIPKDSSKKDKQWVCKNTDNGRIKAGKTIDQIIAEAFEIREVEPTKNNPDSSRSHIICCVTFKGIKPDGDEDYARIVVCDLAGVEDKFTCQLDELIILDNNYSTKSSKYKTLDEKNEPFYEIDKKTNKPKYKEDKLVYKKSYKYKPIKFDDYYCNQKYFSEIVPEELLDKRSEIIDNILEQIKKYENVLIADPIKNSIEKSVLKFKENPCNEEDNKNFILEFKNKISLDSDLSIDALEMYSYNSDSIQLGGSNTEYSNKCNEIHIDAEKNIAKFMEDFTKLPSDFQQKFRTKSDVKDAIIEEVDKLIEGNLNQMFDLTNPINFSLINFNIDKSKTTEIEEINKNIIKLKELNSVNNDSIDKSISNIADFNQKISASFKNKQKIIIDDTDPCTKQKKEYIETLRSNFKTASDELDKYKQDLLNKLDVLIPPSNKSIIERTTIFLSKIDLEHLTFNTFNQFTMPNKYLYNEFKEFAKPLIKLPDLKGVIPENEKEKWPVIYTSANYYRIANLSKEQIQKVNDFINKINKEVENIKKYKEAYEKTTAKTYSEELDRKSQKEYLEKLRVRKDEINTIFKEDKQTCNTNLTQIIKQIQNEYFEKVIKHRYDLGQKNIKEYLEDETKRKKDIEQIRYLIQQYIRFSQLEFNCEIRRKEGYMINTSLREMQKFIGSIIFDSAKKRFNRILIENNLVSMKDKFYKYNDYIKFNNKIINDFNNILLHLKNIIDADGKSNILVKILQPNIDDIYKNCKKLKKNILIYFRYVLYLISSNDKYKEYYNIGSVLILICFINTVINILIHDKINFDIISHSLENVIDKPEYKERFVIYLNSIKLDLTKGTLRELVIDKNITSDNLLGTMFTNLLGKTNNSRPLRILQYFYQYSLLSANKDENYNYICELIKYLFKDETNNNIKITCDAPKILYKSDKNIDTTSPQFKNFYNDLDNIWGIFKKYIQNNIKLFKDEIKKEINTESNNYPTPLLYTSPNIDVCVNNNRFENEYDRFYDYDKKNNIELEFLFKIMTTNGEINRTSNNGELINYGVDGFGLEIENSTMVIFTVINITPNPIAPTNNPPIPPFININKLKLIYNILSLQTDDGTPITNLLLQPDIKNKISKYGKYFIDKLITYSFYKPFFELDTDYYNILTQYNKLIDIDNIKKIIDFIDGNNATTLIGTVEFEKFTKIRDPTKPYFICDGKDKSLLKQLFNMEKIMELLESNDEKDISE